MRELRTWLDEERKDPDGLRPHFPVEIRFSASDDIWLSPSSGQRTSWIGIVQYKSVTSITDQIIVTNRVGRPYGFNVPYRKLFEGYENIVARHQGRPHWAKAHKLSPDTLRKLYPRFNDFTRVIEQVDPLGIFRNEYVQRHIMGSPIDARVFKSRSI